MKHFFSLSVKKSHSGSTRMLNAILIAKISSLHFFCLPYEARFAEQI